MRLWLMGRRLLVRVTADGKVKYRGSKLNVLLLRIMSLLNITFLTRITTI